MNLQQKLVNDSEFKKAFAGLSIYGIAGTNGSGKDTVLQVLADEGYYIFNTGDSLRQITKAVMGTTQRGGNTSPTGTIANAQRAIYPGGMATVAMIEYWSRVLHLPKNLQTAGLAIGSIRSVSEANIIKEFGGKIVVIDADPKVRYERVVKRARTYEAEISLQQFIAEDEAEMGKHETDPAKFSTARVMEMADIKIDNSGQNIQEFTLEIKKKLLET